MRLLFNFFFTFLKKYISYTETSFNLQSYIIFHGKLPRSCIRQYKLNISISPLFRKRIFFFVCLWAMKIGCTNFGAFAFQEKGRIGIIYLLSIIRSLYQVQYTKCNTLRQKLEDIQRVDRKTELSSTNQCPTIAIGLPEKNNKDKRIGNHFFWGVMCYF